MVIWNYCKLDFFDCTSKPQGIKKFSLGYLHQILVNLFKDYYYVYPNSLNALYGISPLKTRTTEAPLKL